MNISRPFHYATQKHISYCHRPTARYNSYTIVSMTDCHTRRSRLALYKLLRSPFECRPVHWFHDILRTPFESHLSTTDFTRTLLYDTSTSGAVLYTSGPPTSLVLITKSRRSRKNGNTHTTHATCTREQRPKNWINRRSPEHSGIFRLRGEEESSRRRATVYR